MIKALTCSISKETSILDSSLKHLKYICLSKHSFVKSISKGSYLSYIEYKFYP